MIHPYDPDKVLRWFNYSVKAPYNVTPPPSRGIGSGSSSSIATPRNLRQLYRKASLIKKLLYRASWSPITPLKRALDELIKGCEIAIYNAAFMLKELNDLRAEAGV
jgi:hypothetical protein